MVSTGLLKALATYFLNEILEDWLVIWANIWLYYWKFSLEYMDWVRNWVVTPLLAPVDDLQLKTGLFIVIFFLKKPISFFEEVGDNKYLSVILLN